MPHRPANVGADSTSSACMRHRTVVEGGHQRVGGYLQSRPAKLLRKTPQFVAARDRRIVVEKLCLDIAATEVLMGHRNHLRGLGVVAESRRIGPCPCCSACGWNT